MLNIEKYKDEILKQVKSGNTFFCAIGNVSDINTCHYCEICDKKCEEKMFNWLLEEYKEPILTEEEKAYLSAVIKPFRDKVKCILKCSNSGEWIAIKIIDDATINFPYFEKGSMYKGMKLDRKYTLEELGL